MAVKIKKKVNRPQADDPNQPDQILVATQETYDWLSENRKPVLGGIAVLTVVMVIATLVWDSWSQRNVEPTRALFATLGIDEAAIGGEGEPDQRTFASTEARDAELLAVLEAFLEGHEGSLAVSAHLMIGGVALRSGDAAKGVEGYQAYADRADVINVVPARIALAGAVAERGDLSAALAILDELAESAPRSFAFAIASQRARLIDAFDSETRALETYRALLEAYPDAQGLDRVENRIRQLEIALAVASAGNE